MDKALNPAAAALRSIGEQARADAATPASGSAERAIPLTPPGPNWSQREYVAATQIGLGFAAHREGDLRHWFHYGFPGDIGCASVLVGTRVERYVDHDFKRAPEWIKACAAAVRRGS